MEQSDNEARGPSGSGDHRGTELEVAPVTPRADKDDRSAGAPASRSSEAQGSNANQDKPSWVTWQSALYLFVLGLISVFLSPLTSFWWLVPVLGMAVPITLAILEWTGPVRERLDDRKLKEQELLEALAEQGELTPVTAAMRTSLTLDEASKMLEELAGKGHLELSLEDGVMAYALQWKDRRALPEGDPAPLEQASGDGAPRQPDEPLSERELEVLALLASGRTNAEISGDLFVALGTVKSHLNNIYRKLGAKNRTEALSKARELDLPR